MSSSNAGALFNFSLSPFFPDHNDCFGSSNTSSVCQVPTETMINFLNISNPTRYLQAYCLNPPDDSCSFGYCPNPDVASPAVRYSTYFTTLAMSIIILHSPEDVLEAFYSQVLNVYSLVIAAVIAIGRHNLTRLHSALALSLAGSPLSLYLLVYVIRSMLHKMNRLQGAFGRGKWLNRLLVLMMVPVWTAVLVFTAFPRHFYHFQQSACDTIVAEDRVVRFFFLPALVLFEVYPGFGVTLLASLGLMWALCIFLQRKEIWKKHNKTLPLGRMWRTVVDSYPFVHFWTVVVIPHTFWMVNVEVGVLLSPHEQFQATYGQLLAIFVTVPPAIQLAKMMPRLPLWFADLAWVRLLTCRRHKPLLNPKSAELPNFPTLKPATEIYSHGPKASITMAPRMGGMYGSSTTEFIMVPTRAVQPQYSQAQQSWWS